MSMSSISSDMTASNLMLTFASLLKARLDQDSVNLTRLANRTYSEFVSEALTITSVNNGSHFSLRREIIEYTSSISTNVASHPCEQCP